MHPQCSASEEIIRFAPLKPFVSLFCVFVLIMCMLIFMVDCDSIKFLFALYHLEMIVAQPTCAQCKFNQISFKNVICAPVLTHDLAKNPAKVLFTICFMTYLTQLRWCCQISIGFYIWQIVFILLATCLLPLSQWFFLLQHSCSIDLIEIPNRRCRFRCQELWILKSRDAIAVLCCARSLNIQDNEMRWQW